MTATAKREEQRSPPSLQLCVYDSRRGKAEGDEADRVLAYHPPDVSPNEQASTVGLAQAVGAFAAIFSQVQLHTGSCPGPAGAAREDGWSNDATHIHTADGHMQCMHAGCTMRSGVCGAQPMGGARAGAGHLDAAGGAARLAGPVRP